MKTYKFHSYFNSQNLPVSWSIPPWLTGKLQLWLSGPLFVKRCLCFLICCLGLSSERAMAPHSSTLAWKIPWMEEPGGLRSMESRRVRHDWATSLSLFTSCIGEGTGSSSVLVWRIPWTEEPDGLPSMGSHRVGHDWSDLAAAAGRFVLPFLPRSEWSVF